jgi:Hemerythrin HHE cation binding domain
MSISLTCGPSGAVITGETEEELVSNVQAHARAHENTELSRARILARIRGKDPQRPIDAAAWAAMTSPSVVQKLWDTSDMVIVHRMFRRECALLPQLVAAVAGGDLTRARTVAGHAREVLDMLHHHHVGEDELLWPRLLAGTRFHADLLARMDQHHGLAVLLEHAATSFTAWQDAPTWNASSPPPNTSRWVNGDWCRYPSPAAWSCWATSSKVPPRRNEVTSWPPYPHPPDWPTASSEHANTATRPPACAVRYPLNGPRSRRRTGPSYRLRRPSTNEKRE